VPIAFRALIPGFTEPPKPPMHCSNKWAMAKCGAQHKAPPIRAYVFTPS